MGKSYRGFAWFVRGARRHFVHCGTCFLATALILSGASTAYARHKHKKNQSATASNQPLPMLPIPASQQINVDIGEMLGAFQVGDLAAMHKYYSNDATFVSSLYEPPVIGWKNYAALYERERASFQGMQLIRRNTYIFVHGDVAWASYQWEFDSSLRDKPYHLRGQTTLVFTKVGSNWLIVHNHTSEICPVCPVVAPGPQSARRPTSTAPAQTAPQTSAQP